MSSGFNDLAYLRPDLAAEFLGEVGGSRTASELSVASHAKARWKCLAHGHLWTAGVNVRSGGNGCPVCAGKWVEVGFNDLAHLRPDLAAEFVHEVSGNRTATQLTVSSNARAEWRCTAHGHFWVSMVATRSAGSGCPVCAGKRVQAGFNDLAHLRSDLAAEFMREVDGDRTASQLTLFSNVRAEWRCTAEGHTWTAKVAARSRRDGCPACGRTAASNIEYLLTGLIAQKLPDAVQSKRLPVTWGTRATSEVDVYSAARQLVIEYDGDYWHRSKFDKDAAKTSALLAAGFRVVRIRSDGLLHLDLSHPNLLQLDYRHRDGRNDARVLASLEPVMAEILDWLVAMKRREAPAAQTSSEGTL